MKFFIRINKLIQNLQDIILYYQNQRKITMIIPLLILKLLIILILALGTNFDDSFAQSSLDPQLITCKQISLGSTHNTNTNNAPSTDIFI